MAKLGMPTVVVKFIEAGIEAIQRSQRGIVALILEDTKQVIDKLATKLMDTKYYQIHSWYIQ